MNEAPVPQCEDLVLAAQYLDTWAATCREKAIEGSVEALMREAEMGTVDHRIARSFAAERKASFLHGYVVALGDAAELLREISV